MKGLLSKVGKTLGVLGVVAILAALSACGRNASPQEGSFPNDFGFNPGDGGDFRIVDLALNLYHTGSFPNRIVVRNDEAFVVNSGNNNIDRINLRTSHVTTGFVVLSQGANPWEMGVRGDKGYVSNFVANTVSVVDLNAGGSPLKNIAPNAKGRLLNPEGVGIAANGLIFVTNIDLNVSNGVVTYGPGFVTVIDPNTREIVNEISTTQKNPQYAVAHGNTVYIVNSGASAFDPGCVCFKPTSDGGIDYIDASTATTATAPFANIRIPRDDDHPLNGDPGHLALTSDGTIGYMGSNSGILYKVDLANIALLRGNDDPIFVTPNSEDNLVIVKADARGVFWVLSFNEDKVYLLDPDRDRVSPNAIFLDADLNTPEGPIDLAFHDEGDFPDPYVLMSLSQEVSAIFTN